MIKELVEKNRSYRRFYEDRPVERVVLEELVDLARHSPSGGNVQPLKYYVSCDAETNGKIFETLAWAGYLTDWDGPEAGERPAGYIVILQDKSIKESPGHDAGIACQSMLLGAVEKGLGGCIFGSIHRETLHASLKLPEHLEILLVVALGVPKETVVLEDTAPEGDIKYYRDPDGTHHVPKRPHQEVIVNNAGESPQA